MIDPLEYTENDWLCPRCCSWSDVRDEPPYQYRERDMHLDCAVSVIASDWLSLKTHGGQPLEEARGILREALAELGGAK